MVNDLLSSRLLDTGLSIRVSVESSKDNNNLAADG